jgi:putative ABC transport system permease protein
VVGLVSTGGVEDSYLFMDLSDMEEMTGEKNLADLAEVSLTAGGDRLKEMVETINGENLALKAQLVTRVTRSEETVLSKITFLVYLVTAVVLLLTMICVGTTMMTVVMERRKEIGLKKALGAENKKLALEFLGEGLVLGIVGGMIGSFFGLVLARVITLNVFNRALGSVGPFLVFLTIFLSALVTVLASLGPVKKAMGVDPVVVLKGE